MEPVKSDTIAYPCFTPVLEFTYQRKSEKEMGPKETATEIPQEDKCTCVQHLHKEKRKTRQDMPISLMTLYTEDGS